jgi:hypothetical protein
MCTRYFKDPNNAIDFLVVAVSIASAASDSMNASVISVARVSRVTVKLFKLVRTVKALRGTKAILETTAASLSSMGNVGGLLVLLMAVYAVIGMKFFWNLKDDGYNYNSHVNFRTFGPAILAMFRVATVRPLFLPTDAFSEAPCAMFILIVARQLEQSVAHSHGQSVQYRRCRRLRRIYIRCRLLLLLRSDCCALSPEYFRCRKLRFGNREFGLFPRTTCCIGRLGPHVRT